MSLGIEQSRPFGADDLYRTQTISLAPETAKYGYATRNALRPRLGITPEKKEAITDNAPIVFVPGWSIETMASEGVLLELFNRTGREISSPQFPRWTGGKVESENNFSGEVVRRARLLNHIINNDLKDSDEIDFVTQSEGAMILSAAAILDPNTMEKTRNIVGVSLAGFSMDDNLPSLIGRFGLHALQDVISSISDPNIRAGMMKTMLGSGLYIGKNPLWALSEAKGIADGRYYQYLRILHDKGVKIGIIQPVDDKLMPSKKLWGSIAHEYAGHQPFVEVGIDDEGNRIQEHVPYVHPPFDMLTLVGKGHDNWVYANPELFVDRTLRQLNRLQSMRDENANSKS